jgi:hypothetical protein
MAAQGVIDAVQLELSVAVRMSCTMRAHAIEAIAGVFSDGGANRADGTEPMPVVRTIKPKSAPAAPKADRPVMPARVGVEFYDPVANVGAMASFDLGPAAMGARIMMLLDNRRVGLFTSEGIARHQGGTIALGPLALHTGAGGIALRFDGPAVIVPDGTAYISIERALASGALDDAVQVSAELELETALNFEELLEPGASSGDPAAAFGRLVGTISIGGETRALDAVARVGLSFTSLASARFVSRRMVWACFPKGSAPRALEARVISNDDGTGHNSARALGPDGWTRCDVTAMELEAPSAEEPPARIAATVTIEGGVTSLRGKVRSFVPLSRPGPNQSRIYTSLGFATFHLGDSEGAGMFEYSRRAIAPAHRGVIEEDSD